MNTPVFKFFSQIGRDEFLYGKNKDKIKFNILGKKEKYKVKVIGFNKDSQNQNITMTKEFLENKLRLNYKPQAIYTNKKINKVTKLNRVSSIQNINDIVKGTNKIVETMMSIIIIWEYFHLLKKLSVCNVKSIRI